MKSFEDKLDGFKDDLTEYRRDLDNMDRQIKTEYHEFTISRKRWKGDFVKQRIQVSMTMQQIEDMVQDVMG